MSVNNNSKPIIKKIPNLSQEAAAILFPFPLQDKNKTSQSQAPRKYLTRWRRQPCPCQEAHTLTPTALETDLGRGTRAATCSRCLTRLWLPCPVSLLSHSGQRLTGKRALYWICVELKAGIYRHTKFGQVSSVRARYSWEQSTHSAGADSLLFNKSRTLVCTSLNLKEDRLDFFSLYGDFKPWIPLLCSHLQGHAHWTGLIGDIHTPLHFCHGYRKPGCLPSGQWICCVLHSHRFL